MLKYLVIVLDDTSVSYCHYKNAHSESKLISQEDLKAGILFAMKENLMIQFVYPEYKLPEEYINIIETIDHSKIVPAGCSEEGNIIVIDKPEEIGSIALNIEGTYVLRISKQYLFENTSKIREIIHKALRINIILTDIETFTDDDFNKYDSCLKEFEEEIERLILKGDSPQLNLLTDRIGLTSMNNCNAGWESIALAPDGNFYPCPGFYNIQTNSISDKKITLGNVKEGLQIKNPNLYKISYAPICRVCDSYQCKRCILLNYRTTLEINTPSHEQCVVSHLERNRSRDLLYKMRGHGDFAVGIDIEQIYYTDPIDKLIYH